MPNFIADRRIFLFQKRNNRQLVGDNRHIGENNRQSEERNRQRKNFSHTEGR
ncbi:hypothetical protein ACFPN4_06550 [Ureibacillus thermophilus]|uniref:hypothetical protein n=1 Tax=Ureibacillus thermophilus TaxID=367743 RepID=UPI001ABF3387|nr:hypothetical protein [Ureibacillus thermophilus]